MYIYIIYSVTYIEKLRERGRSAAMKNCMLEDSALRSPPELRTFDKETYLTAEPKTVWLLSLTTAAWHRLYPVLVLGPWLRPSQAHLLGVSEQHHDTI